MQKIILFFILFGVVNAYSASIEIPGKNFYLTNADLTASVAYFNILDAKKDINFIFFNNVDESYFGDLRFRCKKNGNFLHTLFYLKEKDIIHTEYQISPFKINFIKEDGFELGSYRRNMLGIYNNKIEKINTKTVILTENYFNFSNLVWNSSIEYVLEKASLIRVVINEETTDEIIFSGKYLKVWLKEIIKNGFYYTSKPQKRNDIVCVEMQFDISKTLRYIVQIYVDLNNLPESLRLLSSSEI